MQLKDFHAEEVSVKCILRPLCIGALYCPYFECNRKANFHNVIRHQQNMRGVRAEVKLLNCWNYSICIGCVLCVLFVTGAQVQIVCIIC